MSLSTLYQELHRRARESGEKRGQTLTGGARITVRVSGDATTLTIARKGRDTRYGGGGGVTYEQAVRLAIEALEAEIARVQ